MKIEELKALPEKDQAIILLLEEILRELRAMNKLIDVEVER